MLVAYGHFLFRYRNILFPVVLFTLLIVFKPYTAGGNERFDLWLDIAGILVIITGQAVRAAVIGLAYIKRGGVNKKIFASSLVTEGIFAHCRNPLYVGNLMILTGFLIIHNNPWVYLLGGGFFLLSYIAIVAAEESFLGEKFGDEFNQYCNSVNRWLIDFCGIRKTLASMTFNWKRVISKDHTTFLTWFLTVLLIISYEYVTRHGLGNSQSFLVQQSIIGITGILLVLWVRILKKSGKLAN